MSVIAGYFVISHIYGPLFPIPSQLDPFGKVLLPLQRSILAPDDMSEENETALLPMLVGACLAARWLYNLFVSL